MPLGPTLISAFQEGYENAISKEAKHPILFKNDVPENIQNWLKGEYAFGWNQAVAELQATDYRNKGYR